MANNYSQTSFILDCKTREAAEDVLLFSQALESDDATHPDVEFSDDDFCGGGDVELDEAGTVLWFHDNGESFNFEYFDAVLSYAIKKYKLDPMGFTWANTCSKARVDEFDGGGAVFKYNPETDTVDAKVMSGWEFVRDNV